MVRYYLKETNKEVKFGDIIEMTSQEKTEYGYSTITIKTTITPDNVNILLKKGVIYKGERGYIREVKKKIAKKAEMSLNEADIVFTFLEKYFPCAALKIYLIELSHLMASVDTLSSLEKNYIISMINGKIYSVKTEDISSYNNFAAFKSKEDAEYAKSTFKHLLDKMFDE